ncbi:MAG: FkbM family methyltransferase, partial [Mesorhizobium sp.]
ARMLDSFGLAGIDFLKIDVEGFEKPILEGGEQTIRRERPVIIIEQKPTATPSATAEAVLLRSTCSRRGAAK